jgi:hypothetical protein
MDELLLSPSLDRRRLDLEHLKVLSVFYFVATGLAAAGLLLIYGHYALMKGILAQSPNPPPPGMFTPLMWMYGIMGTMIGVTGILNVCAAFWLRARKHRLFTLGVAIVNCFYMPLGTALGIFTIVVLVRESVRDLYVAGAAPLRE